MFFKINIQSKSKQSYNRLKLKSMKGTVLSMIGYYNYTVVPTYIGLFSSIAGIFLASNGKILYAIFCLLFSGFCDMFDGKISRTKERTISEKRFGIQIDSLSDLICFGVLPAIIGFNLGMNSFAFIWILFVYVLNALIRLAYFNVTEEVRQDETAEERKHYEGLPVTSAALILPFFYAARKLFDNDKGFLYLYAGVLLAVGIAFILPFKLKKPGIKMIAAMLVIGIAMVLTLIFYGV